MKKLLILSLLLASSAAAQTLSPAVKQYVTEEADTFAISNVRVIDGTGTPAKENQVVLIQRGRIFRVVDPSSPSAKPEELPPLADLGALVEHAATPPVEPETSDDPPVEMSALVREEGEPTTMQAPQLH